jgi:hypothetical protein
VKHTTGLLGRSSSSRRLLSGESAPMTLSMSTRSAFSAGSLPVER